KLPLKLVGTIAALGGGIAVLERTDVQPAAVNSFRIGEAVLQDVILEAVYQSKATFLRDGKRIALLVEEKPKAERTRGRGRPENNPAKPAATPGFEKKGDDVKVSRDYVEHVLADMPTLLTSLKATPHMEGGEFRGFLLSAI